MCGLCYAEAHDLLRRLAAERDTLAKENERLRTIDAIKERHIERIMPCPNHRDKQTDRCLACVIEERAERAESALQRVEANNAILRSEFHVDYARLEKAESAMSALDDLRSTILKVFGDFIPSDSDDGFGWTEAEFIKVRQALEAEHQQAVSREIQGKLVSGAREDLSGIATDVFKLLPQLPDEDEG